ncbi:hypothetical protein VSU19_08370 [Verrucomicrobiales bacterium BCK34]|nr:hypothetical protein [Verrucomicrobiales bacterium BCK34]
MDWQAEKERLCVVAVPKGEVTIVHYPFVGSQTTGTAVLRTRMAGGVGGAGSIPVPTRFALGGLSGVTSALLKSDARKTADRIRDRSKHRTKVCALFPILSIMRDYAGRALVLKIDHNKISVEDRCYRYESPVYEVWEVSVPSPNSAAIVKDYWAHLYLRGQRCVLKELR